MAFGQANAVQLGASGVVFLRILLNSLIAYEHRRAAAAEDGVVPLTHFATLCGNQPDRTRRTPCDDTCKGDSLHSNAD